MDRAWEENPSQNPPAPPNPPTLGYPSETNPATNPGAWWWHMITEEQRNVLIAAGIAPDATKTNQLATAIQTIAQNAINNFAKSGSFEATILGNFPGGSITGQINYRIQGNIVAMYANAAILGNANSNDGQLVITGIPGALQPSGVRHLWCAALVSNDVAYSGLADVISNEINLLIPSVGFVAGICGIENGWSITYPL